MKELSIEEKAKRYDEAKARMNRAFNDNRCSIGFMNEIFPEIKESVDTDEKVRKALIKLVTNHASMDLFIEYDIHLDEALSWLEKQGNHSNFLSKIQVGDKVTRNEDGVLVNLSQLKRVAKKDEKRSEQKATIIIPKFRVGDEIKTSNEESLTVTKIDEKGYWSGDLFICGFDEECIWDLVEPKPAWSEEDERYFNSIAHALSAHLVDPYYDEIKLKHIGWFSSLKDRYAWRPSDEQMQTLYRYAEQNNYDGAVLTSLYNDIKKLK